ncbi:MAG TPA: glycosyl hydrolase family 28-related protein [Flavisolibacter sp.]|nr:glycosyl hydrolase family 28-related protein [Flavisolibacter sp.]
MRNKSIFILLLLAGCSTARQGAIQNDKAALGESAYRIWLENGHQGSAADFLAWLKTPAVSAAQASPVPPPGESIELSGYTSITSLGCKADGSTDCGRILSNYIAAQPVNAIINLFIPAGKFYFGSTLTIEDRMVNLRGAGRGVAIIYVAEGVHGIFINRRKGIMSDYTMEKFSLVAYGKKKPGFSGIRMWQRGVLRDLEIQGFSGYGVHIDGYLGGKEDNHDASFSKVYDCFIAACGADGILIDGKDGNACITQNCDIRNNGGWGLRESSFLGGSHYGNMFHANAKGAYTIDHGTAMVLIAGGYTEGDQPPSLITRSTTVLHPGQHFAGIKYKD